MQVQLTALLALMLLVSPPSYAQQGGGGGEGGGGISLGCGGVNPCPPSQGGTGENNGTNTITVGGALTFSGSGPTTFNVPSGSATFTLPAATDTLAGLSRANTWSGVQTFTNSDFALLGSSTGKTTLTSSNSGASNYTATLPAANFTFLTTAGAILQSGVLNPTGTTSVTGVMMGLGSTCVLTPVASTRVEISFDGDGLDSTANDGGEFQVRYGTGTAPVNGAALTGTAVGSAPVFQNPNIGGTTVFPFSKTALITGLTPGTAYWFDLSLKAVTGGTATLTEVDCKGHEI